MPFCQETCFLSAKLFASRCCWPKISRGVYLAPTVFQINFFHIFTHKKESLASNWKAGGGDIQGTGSPLPPPHWAGPLAPYASVVPASVGQAIVPALDRQCGFWASMISCPSVPPALSLCFSSSLMQRLNSYFWISIQNPRERIRLVHSGAIVHQCSNQLLPPNVSRSTNTAGKADFKRERWSLETGRYSKRNFRERIKMAWWQMVGILWHRSGWGNQGGVKR